MRNNIKHALVALVAAAILLAFSACADDDFFGDDEQTTVTIINIPNEYVGKYASGGLANPVENPKSKKDRDMAVALPRSIKTGGTVTLDMLLPDGKAASVNNKNAIVILFITNSNNTNDEHLEEKYYVKVVKPGSNTFDYVEDFEDF
jgi:hypothetical protein